MSNKKSILFVFCTLFFLKCNNNVEVINPNELQKYFETDEIQNKLVNNKLEISVKNSKLLNEKQEGEFKWDNLEAYASIGALIASKNVSSILKVDSVILCLSNKGKDECYQYSYLYLKKISNFVNVSRSFFSSWGKKDYEISRSYLSNDLKKEFPTADLLKAALSPIIFHSKINDSKLIAFKIEDKIVGLYINAYYDNGKVQTYIFNFSLIDSTQIIGITVPTE